MRRWLKPVVDVPITTTSYVLSQRIQPNLRRTQIMNQELDSLQTKMVSKRTKMLKARKGTPDVHY
jgi:hypothetical protein